MVPAEMRHVAFFMVALCNVCSAAEPSVTTSLGQAHGTYAAAGVERYGGIPYAVPPLGPKRFARAEVSTESWSGGQLDARRPGPPCIQNPLGDPRSTESESPPPSEDCLQLNLWRPSQQGGRTAKKPLPVMAWVFGGGLCGNFAGNEMFNGSELVMRHNVVVVTIQYRLGALGFMVGDDPARPGSGGMNGLYDNVVALQWLQKHVGSFGGDAGEVTVFGQSSGAYSLCTISIAPSARGLFQRTSLLSGPCIGGPPGKGWGPISLEKGRNVTKEILRLHGANTLDDLRAIPADQIQWPDEYMNDPTEAPSFSAYFEDSAVLPEPAEELWIRGAINPKELIVSFTSRDGTGAFYGTAPTLGNISPDKNTNTPAGYKASMQAAWGKDTETVMKQYPLTAYPSAPDAFLAADAEAYVICPSRRVARHAAAAGRKVWVSEFAHFQPSVKKPLGCVGDCEGWGCDAGVELDAVPGHHTDATKLFAAHGSDFHFIFGTEVGPDGLGPPSNVTYCNFNSAERDLSNSMMDYWTSFARYGDPNKATIMGSPTKQLHWPSVQVQGAGNTSIQRMRFSVAETDGVPTGLVDGVNANCDFWDALYPFSPSRSAASEPSVDQDLVV